MNMGPTVPVLNEHKQQFLLRRFLQTVLGGPRFLLGHPLPSYVYLNQIILFLIPWALGGVGTLLYQLNVLQDYSTAALSGGLMLAAATVVQVTAFSARRRRVSVAGLHVHHMLSEEDEWEFSSCMGSETVKFIIPGKKYVFNIVCHSVLAGVLCALGTWYLLPNRIALLYDGNIGASAAVFVFGWVTVCIGEYSLIINTPSETAVFQALDTYEIMPLMRPFYILAFAAVDLADRFTADIPDLKLANQVLHIVFLLLPVLWTLGFLPPPDALFFWALEQVLEIGLGGSPMSSNIRLLAMLLVSVGTVFAARFISSSVGVVLFMTSVGFLLSLNLSQIGIAVKDVVICCLPSKKFKDVLHRCKTQFIWRELFFYLTVLTLALLEASFLHHWHGSEAFSQTSPQAVVSYVLIALLLSLWVLQEIQTVYVFGIFRNPFYPKDTLTANVFGEKQKRLSAIGAFRRILGTLVSPFAMIAFLSLDNSLHHLPSLYGSVGFARSFRMVWQNTECALLDMVVVSVVQLLVFSTDLWWNRSIDLGTRLLLVGLIRDRLFQFVSRLQFVLTVLVTSWTEKKQRRKSSAALMMLNVGFFPVVLALIALSALLASPLLPLFSLPIFMVGFPRPIRSWPGPVGLTACVCHDTIYYQQMVPSLAMALQAAWSSGSLGWCSSGSHYLCRFQDRLVWILVVERGFSYCCVNIKGLELQETSCHTAEAHQVDEVFGTAFEYGEHTQSSSLNHHFGNILTPCTVLPVKLYSDARNVLSGIIDSPENRQQLKDDFIKVLLWLLVPPGYKKFKAQKMSEATKQASPLLKPPEVLSKTVERRNTWKEDDRLSTGSVGDWTDDSSLFDAKSNRSTPEAKRVQPIPSSSCLPGSVDTHTAEDELAEVNNVNKLYKPMLYGLPAVDTGDLEVLSPPCGKLSNPHSELLAITEQWTTVHFPNADFKAMKGKFPEDWFQFVLGELYFAQEKDSHFTLLDLMTDPVFQEACTQLVFSCCIGMFGLDNTIPSPGLIFRIYSGDISWSICMDWLIEEQELFQLALKAFRYTVKLMIDKASLGPVESFKELQQCLEEYEKDWYIGMDSEKEWQEAVLQNKPYLFSLGRDANNMGVYTSRTLTLGEFPVPVGRLSGEAVRGQWANLSWELLYATNDDEERFSIQAHPILLRNLTVQAADPPLGYPVYSSKPLYVPLPWDFGFCRTK